jgi:hypothetical protein
MSCYTDKCTHIYSSQLCTVRTNLVIYVFIEGKNVNSIIEINIYTFCTYNVRPVSGITFFMYAHNQKIGKPNNLKVFAHGAFL